MQCTGMVGGTHQDDLSPDALLFGGKQRSQTGPQDARHQQQREQRDLEEELHRFRGQHRDGRHDESLEIASLAADSGTTTTTTTVLLRRLRRGWFVRADRRWRQLRLRWRRLRLRLRLRLPGVLGRGENAKNRRAGCDRRTDGERKRLYRHGATTEQ